MLVGSVHPSLGALLSAHQSIGVPSRSRCSAPMSRSARGCPGARTGDQRVPADRARRRLATRRGCARPRRRPDGNGYVLNGVKLWTTNGVIADLLVVMAQVPESDGRRGGITRVRGARPTQRASPWRIATRSWDLRGIENGLTRLTTSRTRRRTASARRARA